MANGQTIRERLAVVEEKVDNIETNVIEIKKNVEILVVNGALQKGKRSVWDKVLAVILGTLAGFFAGKWG